MTPAAPSFSLLGVRARSAWAWWIGELRATLPARLRGERRKRVDAEITLRGDGWFVRDRFGHSYVLDPRNRPAVDEALRTLKGRRKRGRVVLCVPASRCFVRRTELPRAMLGQAAALLRSELENATPFGIGDVHWDWHVAGPGAEPGTLAVAQVVLKRRDTDAAFTRLADANVSCLRVEVLDDATAPARRLPVDLLRQVVAGGSDPQLRKARGVLAGAAALATAAIVPLAFSQQSGTLAALDAEIADAEDALALHPGPARTPLAQLGALLDAKRTTPPSDVLLDRLAAVVPADSLLEHLFLDNGVLTIQGRTTSLRKLERALETSPVFSAGHNLGSTAGDTDQGAFAIRLKVKPLSLDPEA